MNNSIVDTGIDNSYTITYNYKVLETHSCGIVVGRNNMFGNILFYEDEIQIAQVDMERFHGGIARLFKPEECSNILIVGDGDGGYTNYDWARNTDVVEPSLPMMDVGTRYFGANWNNIRRHYHCKYEDFVADVKYDAAIFAITDGFMRQHTLDTLDSLRKIMNPGSVVIFPVGCSLDSHTRKMIPVLKMLDHDATHHFDISIHEIYCEAFFCNFVVARIYLYE